MRRSMHPLETLIAQYDMLPEDRKEDVKNALMKFVCKALLEKQGTNDSQLFREAFDKLDRGRIYVRICNMRRELGWCTERFDAEMCRLRSEGIIQLHAGDSTQMTDEDVELSYVDRNNFSYTTMTWRKR